MQCTVFQNIFRAQRTKIILIAYPLNIQFLHARIKNTLFIKYISTHSKDHYYIDDIVEGSHSGTIQLVLKSLTIPVCVSLQQGMKAFFKSP